MTTLADLISQETQAALFSRLLQFCTTSGLQTSTWHEGDPERTLIGAQAYEHAALEQVCARYVASKFLDLAAALTDTKWLKLAAYEQYGYTAREATYATCTVRLTNASGNVYTIGALDLAFALDSDSAITYRNTSGGTLNPSSTLDVDIECEVAGSTGSAIIGDITTMVTSVLGVTCANTTAAVGVDEESPSSIVAGCRNKLESLSPNGAAGAYAYVALNADLTGAADVTRVRVIDDSDTGDVIVYLASSSGSVSGADRTLVEAAIQETCVPLTITPTVTAASAYPVAITYSATVYDSVSATVSEIEDAIEAALALMIASVPIGGDGDDGKVFRSRIIHAISAAYPGYVIDVSVTLPAADVTLTASQVATLGTVTPTITVETAP